MNVEDLRLILKEQEKLILNQPHNFGILQQPPPPPPPPPPSHSQQVQPPIVPPPPQPLPTQPPQSQPQLKPNEETSYRCEQCGFTSKIAETLILHKLREHEGTSPFQCTHCGFNTTSKWRLEKHLLIHTGAHKIYQCGLCNFTATSRYYLDKHNLEHAGISEPFQCKLCGFSASSKYYLDKHKISHAGDASPYKCSHCIFSASSKYFLKKHKLSMHSGPPTSYRCDQCDYDTTSKYYLGKHKRSRRGDFTQPFENEQNKFGGSSPDDLDKNKPERSAEVFPCDQCDFRATSKYNLEKHKLLHNSSSRPVLCNDCGFSPVTQMDFLKHAIYHQKLNTPFFNNQFEIDAALKYFYEAQKQNPAPLNLIQTEKSSTVTNSNQVKSPESSQNERGPTETSLQPLPADKAGKKKLNSEISKQPKPALFVPMKQVVTNPSSFKGQENFSKVNQAAEMKLIQLCNQCPFTANDMNRNQFLFAGKPFQCDQPNSSKNSSTPNNKTEQLSGSYYCSHCGSTKYPTQDSIFSCEMCFFSALSPVGLFNHVQEHKDGGWSVNFQKGAKNVEANLNAKGMPMNNASQTIGGMASMGKNIGGSEVSENNISQTLGGMLSMEKNIDESQVAVNNIPQALGELIPLDKNVNESDKNSQPDIMMKDASVNEVKKLVDNPMEMNNANDRIVEPETPHIIM